MLWPIIVVISGLFLTLIGMIITFRADPPNPKLLSIEEHAKRQTRFLLALKQGKIPLRFLTKTEWSLAGIYMLWGGTSLQLIGTVWQLIRLARRA